MILRIKDTAEQQVSSFTFDIDFYIWRMVAIKLAIDDCGLFKEHPWHPTDIYSIIK